MDSWDDTLSESNNVYKEYKRRYGSRWTDRIFTMEELEQKARSSSYYNSEKTKILFGFLEELWAAERGMDLFDVIKEYHGLIYEYPEKSCNTFVMCGDCAEKDTCEDYVGDEMIELAKRFDSNY